MFEESEASYTALFNSLKARGLRNVWLAVSDAHQGLVNEVFAAKLKQIWQQPDDESARWYARMLIDEYENRFPKAIETLENGLEQSLQYYQFKGIDFRKISSTKPFKSRRYLSVDGVLYKTCLLLLDGIRGR